MGCCSKEKKTCSCQTKPVAGKSEAGPEHFITGKIPTAAGEVFRVSTSLTLKDTLGSWKARWDIRRMDYKVEPGLYGVGNPDGESPVLVSANYKLSFDTLRRELGGIDAWILVLDTGGVNVWCAAGKGTFGTEELVQRLNMVKLSQIVTHRTIIVPQLGAPSVAAHEVLRLSGFRVVYGPVRAADLREFLAAGLKATAEMRQVRFPVIDRLVLTPVELVALFKPLLMIGAVLFMLSLLGLGSFSFANLYPYIGAILLGCVIVPVLLPWIPGRAFSWKGWVAGALWVAVVAAVNRIYYPELYSWQMVLIYFLTVPAITSFLALNFTGASTYTSPSGVKKETMLALPLLGCSAAAGIVLILVNWF